MVASTINAAPIRVEPVRPIVARQRAQRAIGQTRARQPQRQVDPEDQRPVQLLREHAAQDRTDHARRHEHRRDHAPGSAPVPSGPRHRRSRSGPARSARRHRCPAAHGRGSVPACVGATAQATEPSSEQGEAGEQHGPPAMDVAQLAVERRHRGRADQIGGYHPGQVVEIVAGRGRSSARPWPRSSGRARPGTWRA